MKEEFQQSAFFTGKYVLIRLDSVDKQDIAR